MKPDASKRVDELAELRSEGSETWTLESGERVTEFFAQPKWYRGGEGEWAKVDPVVVPVGDPGAPREDAGVVLAASGVGFVAEFARSDVGVRLEFEGRSVQVVPRGRAGVVPELDGESDTVVWYRDVFDSVDLRYTVTATGLKEDFVVRSASSSGQCTVRSA